MKNLSITLVFVFLGFTSWAQENSRNNFTGSWTSNSSWVDGSAALTANICCKDHNIYGYITRYGDLDFAQANDKFNIYIRDTLVVTGNMTFGNKSMNLRIPAGGVLIVFGNFSADNMIQVENGGIIVVKGNMTFSNSSQDNYTSSSTTGGLFVGGTVSGNTAASTDNETFTGLSTRFSALYNFVQQPPGPGMAPLPVDLLYFKASAQPQGIQLEWASTKEWNFSHYTVERSEDGKNFTPIHTEYVNGDSYTTKHYTYLDAQPNFGANYYRLKTTDVDQTVEYKGVTVAYAGTKGDLQVYPNPAKGGLVIIKNPGAIEGTWLSIQGITGQELMRIQMAEQELRLPTSALPTGLYIIKVWNLLEVKQARLVIQ